MAAPVADKIILPLDTGNTGKKNRTQTRVVGADTVHEHFVIPISKRKILTVHGFVSALQSVQASAHANNTGGFLWFQNPAGAAVRTRIRKLVCQLSMVTELDHLTVPRLALTRFTFTGTASGATLATTKRAVSAPTGDTVDAALVSSIRTAITGMTCTYESGYYWAATVPAYHVTTSGIAFPDSRQAFEPNDEEEYFDFGPGEGAVIWQPDAGTASDGRRFVVNGRIDEYDNA